MGLLQSIEDFAGLVGITLGIFLFGHLIERLAPVERRQPLGDLGLNLGYAMASSLIVFLMEPALAIGATATLNRAGLGWIALPSEGWALIGSIAIYLLLMDFLDYLFHRAQHAWPWLWAMHSLHHSDRSMNVTTTQRNFWIEPLLKALFLFPLVPLLFKVPAPAILAFAMCTYLRLFSHLNLRLCLGPLWPVVIGPQFHRIHHSRLPEHYDKNFAPLFPIFDILFGTCHRPRPGEFPPTGLASGEAPAHLGAALIWPWRAQDATARPRAWEPRRQ